MDNHFLQKLTRSSVQSSVCRLILLSLVIIQIGSATVFFQDGTDISGDTLIETMANTSNVSTTPFPIQFFYNNQCGSCQSALDYMKEFTRKNPDVVIQYHDLFNSTTNSSLYNQYKDQFNRKDIHYPVVFVGDIAIMGSADIAKYLDPLTVWYQKNQKKDPIKGIFSWIASFTRENK
ncbi:MAG TPA: hypothetical protein VN372_11610 [Methanospirillum sp.]|nr:hypothetical protein [Methanospirillum sp.]